MGSENDGTAGTGERDELELRRRECDLLTTLIQRLLETPDIDPEVTVGDALAELGRFLGADRAYTFVVNDERRSLTNTHEWCAEGVTSEMAGLADLPFEAIPLIAGLLRDADPVAIPSVDALGDEHQADREHLRAQGIRSIYIVPQIVDGRTVGTVGVDYVHAEAAWPQETVWLLRAAAQAFAQAIERHRILDERLGLLRRSVSSADDERQRLAEHLHDDVVQLLTAALLRLELLDADPEATREVHRPLLDAVMSLRTTISELARPDLRPDTLASAIEHYAHRVLEPDGITTTIRASIDDGDAIASEMLTTVYRITQEALSNVRRHAHATNVSVTIERRGTRLVGTVVDDGVGIDAQTVATRAGRPDHLGLRLMRERAQVRGGAVHIASRDEGDGTIVSWHLPVTPDEMPQSAEPGW